MEAGTLKELNVKPGDVVECVSLGRNGSSHYVTVGKRYTINPNRSYTDDGGEINFGFSEAFRIISRASDTPNTWGEMTDAEKGALLLAAHEGKVIEGWDIHLNEWRLIIPEWFDIRAYRVRPEPVRETVTLQGRKYTTSVYPDGVWDFDRHEDLGDTHRITFTTENGKPVCDSIRMEEL